MPIPDLVDNVLPEGIHDCTFEEVRLRFGKFQGSDRRPDLSDRLDRYVQEVRATGIARSIIVDGSFITSKPAPSDIDLILVLKAETELSTELTPREYNVSSSRAVRRNYRFDVLVAVEGSDHLDSHLALFSTVKLGDPAVPTNATKKGLLRVVL